MLSWIKSCKITCRNIFPGQVTARCGEYPQRAGVRFRRRKTVVPVVFDAMPLDRAGEICEMESCQIKGLEGTRAAAVDGRPGGFVL